MTAIYDFIIVNYTWILIIVIIILLAIIGSYADKTNFGEGRKNQLEKPKKEKAVDLSNKKLGDIIPNNVQSTVQNDKPQTEFQSNGVGIGNTVHNNSANNIENLSSIEEANQLSNGNSLPSDNLVQINTAENDIPKNLSIEEKLSKLDDEISSILPNKKELDESILEDLDDLIFDSKLDFKSKKNDFDFGDLSLPKIKSLKEEPEDIWNFKY